MFLRPRTLVMTGKPVRIASVMSVAQIVMYIAVSMLDRPVAAVIAIGAWGIAAGCFAPLTSAALPRLFGRRYLGSIAGLQMSCMVVGSAVGPALFALVQSISDSYRPALWISLVIPATGVIVSSLAGSRPVRPSHTGLS